MPLELKARLARLVASLRGARDPERALPRRVRQTVDPLRQAGARPRLKIVCLDVDHGDATLIIFPTGRVALVDSAKEAWCRSRVLPFLRDHAIGELSYYLTTHYHEDHVGLRDEIIRELLVKQVWDYRSFEPGAELELEGTRLTILNAHGDSSDENDRSLAFRLELDGFVYCHGADLYADGQERILARFPERVRAHVYRANHHLHGSFSQRHLREVDPVLVVVSAQEAVYERVAYTRDFLEAVRALRAAGGRLRDVHLTLEKGNVLIWANGESDWGYSSYSPRVILCDLYP